MKSNFISNKIFYISTSFKTSQEITFDKIYQNFKSNFNKYHLL
jgi:hypothetical protein